MKEEINAAVLFLSKLIGKNDFVTEDKINDFKRILAELLEARYQNHWFPERPTRGQAFRCIRVNENDRRDPSLQTACKRVGIKYEDLKLPLEMTLWVDPEEVTARFGEHKGSYCVIAKIRDGNKENYLDEINVEELEKKAVERMKQQSFDLINSARKRRQNQLMAKQLANGSQYGWCPPNGTSGGDRWGTGVFLDKWGQANANHYQKANGYGAHTWNSSLNGHTDWHHPASFGNLIPTTSSSPSSYYGQGPSAPYFGPGNPFTGSGSGGYGSSPPHQQQYKYSSPSANPQQQSRSNGGGYTRSGLYLGHGANSPTNGHGGNSSSSNGGRSQSGSARGLQSMFNQVSYGSNGVVGQNGATGPNAAAPNNSSAANGADRYHWMSKGPIVKA